MKKIKSNLYISILIALIAIFLTCSINGQEELQNGSETEVLKDKTAQISELIPIKEGTALRKIGSEKDAGANNKLNEQKIALPKQNQGYVRPTSKQRFKRYLNRTVGTGLIGIGAGSIVQQISENPPEWEQNGEGFLRRVGSNFGTQVIRESVAYGLEESLKLDSKFYKSKKKDFGSRVKNAFLSSFTARTPSGKRVFNPSRVAGRYTAEVIAAETWFPERYSYKDGLREGTQGIGFEIGFNFLREFLFPK